jgi:hypothetical protein
MSLNERYRDYSDSERGNGKFTIVAYRANSVTTFLGCIDSTHSSDLRCIECDTVEAIEETLVTLEKENLGRERGQQEWVVRIYRGADLTMPRSASEDSDDSDDRDGATREVLVIDFAAIEAKAGEEHEESQRTLMAVRMIQAHELAEKAAAEKEAKDRAEFQRLREKYSDV